MCLYLLNRQYTCNVILRKKTTTKNTVNFQYMCVSESVNCNAYMCESRWSDNGDDLNQLCKVFFFYGHFICIFVNIVNNRGPCGRLVCN